MKLLGGNTHLTAKAELAAVGKAGGNVDVNRRAVNTARKCLDGCAVGCHDGLAVAGRVRTDVCDGLVHAVHNAHGENIVEKFGIKVDLSRRGGIDDGQRARIGTKLYGNLACIAACVHQSCFEQGQEIGGDILVHQTHLACVANRGTAGFGVVQDGKCLVNIGTLVYVNMANARARLNAGNGGVFDAGADQARATARNQHVHVAVCLHQIGRALARGVLNEIDKIGAKSRACKSCAKRGHDSGGGFCRVTTGTEHANAACLDCQCGGVRGHVGTAFVNDGDHAHSGRDLAHNHAVGTRKAGKLAVQGGGQGCHVQNAGGHTLHACGVQAQSVQHDVRDATACGLKILGVCRQNGIGICDQSGRHGGQRLIDLLCCIISDFRHRALGGDQNFVGGSHIKLLSGRGIVCPRPRRPQCGKGIRDRSRWQ